jgi:hypothetical protein
VKVRGTLRGLAAPGAAFRRDPWNAGPGDGVSSHADHGAEEETNMDHATHERLASAELTESNLVDATIYGPDDEKIGSVSHLHGSGPGAEVILDVGGFLGIGAKPVALPVSRLDFMRDEGGKVHATTSMTRDQVKALPEHRH